MAEKVDHPEHYGGKDNPYEAIKVIDAWELSFSLGNAIKYICRAGKKLDNGSLELGSDFVAAEIRDLKKARWYIDHEIERLSK